MERSLPLADGRKLSVIYRVEPGCLGPDGENKIVEFCKFAQRDVQSLDIGCVGLSIEPRVDKKLPEMQYNVVGKKMNRSQAEKYLHCFDKSLDEFESHLIDRLAVLIDDYNGQ